MRIIAIRTLREFWQNVPGCADAKGPLEAWHAEVSRALWETPHDIKAQFGTASIVGNERVVFNVGGNKYRLVAAIDWRRQIVFIRFVGTHRQYDAIDARYI